jgi:hypothetical protein
MNVSRLKKLFAGVSVVAISLTQVGTVLAAYSDVPAGVWYEDAVDAFTDAGYLDESQTRFRGGDNANRAEFIKLVVELNGGILSTPPAVPSFDDVKPGAWYYGYMEEAAKEGWVKGDNNCYGSHPCYSRPGANINRAEAAALIVRAFGLDATGDADAFVDVPSGQWYTDAIQTAADHCVIQGDDATGRARPADFMNRAEMVVMLNRVDAGLTFGVDCDNDDGSSEPMIKDVTPTSATTVEVEFNVALDEDASVDASKYMVSGADDIDVESVEWIDESTVEVTLSQSTEANEDYTMSVEDMMTEDGDSFSDSMDFNGYTEIVQGDGILEVSLASTNPAADTVPQGAVGVVLASVDLTASCDDDVIISEITVLHEGFGDDSDISGVYAAIDGGRVTRKRSLDSQDQTADLRFTEALTVDACKTETVDIVADFNTSLTAGAEHNIAVELPSDFQSNARDVEGNFPVRGNTFRIAAVTSGQVTVDYRTISPDEVDVGDEGRVVGKFEISANSTEDQTIYSVTFEQNGSASDGDISNIKVRRSDGTVLTNTASSTVGDFVTLVFDPPFTVLEGDSITLEVVADIEGGAAETVVMHLEETSDLFAVGSLYGYGVNGQLYGSRVSIPTDDADTVTIQAGEFTIELDGPVQQKYTRDDDDAVLAKINMLSGGDETIDIKDLFIAIEGQTSTGAGLGINVSATSTDNVHEVLEDVELRNTKTGQTISAVRLTTAGSATAGDFFTSTTESWQIYRFDDFTVDGTETWEVRADFIDNGAGVHPKSGDKFRVHVCAEPVNTDTSTTDGCTFGGLITQVETYNMTIEGLSTGDAITDVRPGGNITGNFHRIAAAELNVAVKSIGTSDTAVRNSKNVNLFRFEARAGEAVDVLFTKASFSAHQGSLLNAQNYALWVDTDGDSVVDTILEKGSSAQSSVVTFDDLAGGGFVIPAEETVMFEVHGDIASNFQANTTIRLGFNTGSTLSNDYIEAEEVGNGSSLSGIKTNATFPASVTSADIIVTTVTSKIWSLVNSGDLFVTKDSETVRSRQLLGGTLGDSVLRLQFRAQNEDIDVTDIQIASSGSTAASFDRLELYKSGETTAFATATVGGCGTDDVLTANPIPAGGSIQTFCANMESRQLIVPKGKEVDVVVRPRLKTDENGATSGEDVQLWVPHYGFADNTTGSGAIRARGAESSTTLNRNNGGTTSSGAIFIGVNAVNNANAAIRGNLNEVVLSKITSITNADPLAGTSPNVPTSVQPIGQFKFTAATNNNTLNGVNKATLSGVIFTVSATNIDLAGGNFKWYNSGDTGTKVACDIVTSQASGSGSLGVRCLDTANLNTEIDSGQSVTFILEADITNPVITGANTSTLQVSIQSFTNIGDTVFGATTSHISWLDKDTTSTQFKWVEFPDTVVNGTSYRS